MDWLHIRARIQMGKRGAKKAATNNNDFRREVNTGVGEVLMCVDEWVCGCVGVWVCGRVGVWACGCVGVWVGSGLVVARALGSEALLSSHPDRSGLGSGCEKLLMSLGRFTV